MRVLKAENNGIVSVWTAKLSSKKGMQHPILQYRENPYFKKQVETLKFLYYAMKTASAGEGRRRGGRDPMMYL